MALAREDWIEAALAALASDGVAGVAVDPLARRLGATKGSFYWHFANRDELLAAALERWEVRDTTDVVAALDAIPQPRARLDALVRAAFASAARGGDAHAAVLAAASDPRVAPVLERVTLARLAALERLYRDAGDASPRARARLAYSLYLGVTTLPRAAPTERIANGALEAQVRLMLDALQ